MNVEALQSKIADYVLNSPDNAILTEYALSAAIRLPRTHRRAVSMRVVRVVQVVQIERVVRHARLACVQPPFSGMP